MSREFVPEFAVYAMRNMVVAMVRRGGAPMTSHQLGVFLICYLEDADHTVRALALNLHVSKAVISRALDRLGKLDLTVRKPDPRDARSILVGRTAAGLEVINDLRRVAGSQAFDLQGPALRSV